ncbi:MAG TPA: hypothetical protein PKB10_02195 [Tepidisphaeraceae bacterium]|nr:hypothetical protein [Tepidisphaeraceae bacterium]
MDNISDAVEGPSQSIPAFMQPRGRVTLRSRLPLLIVILLLTGLTATCGFYSALGFVEQPNVSEFFPAILCIGVTILGLVFFWGLVRDVLPGRRTDTPGK